VSRSVKTACDACGKEQDGAPMDWCAGGNGWLTVTRTGQIVSSLMPHEYSAKYPNPDLCSWKCVAEYAAQRAGHPEKGLG